MGQSSHSREERRAALLTLRRLLTNAEALLSVGGEGSGEALEMIAEAFELFRARHESEEGRATPAPDRETSASSLGRLARLLTDVDESVTSGDPTRARAALEKVREALDIARRLDESSHVSGIRLRLGPKPAK